MGKKYTLEYENSPLGGILDRQLFLATDEWKNKLATIKDVQTIVKNTEGTVENALKLGGQFPAYYLDSANFTGEEWDWAINGKLDAVRGTATELTVVNDAIGNVPIKVNAKDGTTTNLQEWQVNGATKVVIDETGSIGIGIADPTAKLDVLGDIKGSGNASFAGDIVLGDVPTNLWSIKGESSFVISQDSVPVITIHETETTGDYPVKVNIDAKTTITELEFGGW